MIRILRQHKEETAGPMILIPRKSIRSLGITPIIVAATCVASVALSEVYGYSWPVVLDGSIYLSSDTRIGQTFAFGVLAACGILLVAFAFQRLKSGKTVRSIESWGKLCLLAVVWTFGFIVQSFAENLVYPTWVLIDALVFIMTLAILRPARDDARPTRRASKALVFAILVTASLFFPAMGSAQRIQLNSGTMQIFGTQSAIWGVVDTRTPGPLWGQLVQAKTYHFYFDVLSGRVSVSLFGSPDPSRTDSTVYWIAGESQGFKQWNGFGVSQFDWTPNVTGFYWVSVNSYNPDGSTIFARITGT